MMPLRDILKNKLLLQENFNTNEGSMDDWPFWQFEENIKIANSIIEEKEKARKKEEETQKQQMPNMNPSQYTSGISGMMNKFKK